MAQKISEPSAAELQWIAQNVAAARAYAGLADGAPLDPAALDAAWARWLPSWQPGAGDANPVINALGCALGQHLVTALGLAWKVVEDEYGTELAVHGQPGDVLVFPANLVAKRLAPRVTGFFVPIAAAIAEQVAKLRTVQ